jgi:hypothetical protein
VISEEVQFSGPLRSRRRGLPARGVSNTHARCAGDARSAGGHLGVSKEPDTERGA